MRVFFNIGSFVYIPQIGVNAYEVVDKNKNIVTIVNNGQMEEVELTKTRNVWVANEPNRLLLDKLFGEQFQKPLTTSEVLWNMFTSGNRLVPVVWKDDVEDDEYELSKSKWEYEIVSYYEFMLDTDGEVAESFERLDPVAVKDYNKNWLVCSLESGLPVYKYA